MNTKKFDVEIYLPMLKELVEEGREVSLTITGNSMAPFLKNERDVIVISPIEGALKVGDMAFYQRAAGQYVMHRVRYVRMNEEAKVLEYYFVGDAQDYIEGPISGEQIFGKVTSVCRKGKWIEPGHLCWEFYSKVWIRLVPVRRAIFKIYGWTVGRVRK